MPPSGGPVASVPPMPESFAAATAVTPSPGVPGRFDAHIPPTWSTPGGVHGGMLVAAGLRAARDATDRPELAMRLAHAVFLAPPSNDLLFDVVSLRQGKRSAHVRVTGTCVRQDHAAIDLTVVFTADGESPAWLDARHPDVPPPEQLSIESGFGVPAHGGPIPPPPLFDHLDVRSVIGMVPWAEGWTPDQPARHVRWNRYLETPRCPDGSIDPLGLLPFADLPGPAVWVKGRPGEMPMFFLSLDLSISFLEPVPEEWVLTDIRARWVGSGHVYAETDLWSGGRLVATSTQTMLRRIVP
jgi:acyl-CoA thioesterase